MLVTVFVFIGIEGASVYSRYAKKRADIGRATVTGSSRAVADYRLSRCPATGCCPARELGAPPAVHGGGLGIGRRPLGCLVRQCRVIISVLGAYLAWSLMAAEVLFVAAKDRDMGRRSELGSTPPI